MKTTQYLICVLFLIPVSSIVAQQEVMTLSEDGAWCWFSDPRAIWTNGNKIVTGWVKKDGSVEAASLDLDHAKIETKILFPEMQVDDHNNPAFCLLEDGNILTMYTWHSTKKGIVHQSTTTPGDISTFSKPVVIKPGIKTLLTDYPRETFTYANPFRLEDENQTIYSFGRWIGFKPNMITSTDQGLSWHDPRVIINSSPFDPNNRPYVKYESDGKSQIHMVFTDGHPRNEPNNGVYHCYYENGKFWKTDGSKISDLDDLPFVAEDATVVYQPHNGSGRSWIADIAIDKKGNPVILYTRHPEEDDHRYHYARSDSKKKRWLDAEICAAGKWVPQDVDGEIQREPHYHGNMTFHPSDPRIIFISRQINGRFEIEKRKISKRAKTTRIWAITSNSQFDQVRPYVPRNTPKKGKTALLWMENRKYIHYTDYDTKIKYWIDD